MARDLTNALLANPNQASTVFGVGGAHPIRQKSLFVMCFTRSSGQGASSWESGINFLVKSVDRPSVQPTVEELNQYNKKRVIHTGIKYSPINCTIYDTADGAAMSMWVEYAKYYFGDYNQSSRSYLDDIISPTMFGAASATSVAGYGFQIPKTSSTSIDGSNTQFFFDSVDVYQVWGGEYTQYSLIHPRITNFAPDDLDYESSGASMISMTLAYEAINHANNGAPQKISTSAMLSDMFGGMFNGETPDPVPSAVRQTDFTSTGGQASTTLTVSDLKGLLNSNTSVTYTPSDRSATTTSSGGALSKYGSFNFGNFTALGSTLPTELSSLTSSNATQDAGALSDPFPTWVTTTQEANELELARITQSQTANTDAITAALGTNASSLSDVASGVGSASLLTGTSPTDQVSYGDVFMAGQDTDTDTDLLNDAIASGMAFPIPLLDAGDTLPAPAATSAVVTASKIISKGGLSLSPLVIAAVNTNSDGRSQIGQRKSASNPLLAFIVEPTPSTTLTPDLVFGSVRSLAIAIGLSGYAAYSPRPLTSSAATSFNPVMHSMGYVTVSGTISATIQVAEQSHSIAAVSGKISATIIPTTNLLGVGYILISSPQPLSIKITAASVARTTVSGIVDHQMIVIPAALSGQVVTRSGSMQKIIFLTGTAVGRVIVSGAINEPITVASNIVSMQPLRATVSAGVKIAPVISGMYYPFISGTISKAITITSNTLSKTIAPMTGTIAKTIVVTPNIVGNMLYGTINSSVAVKSSIAVTVVIAPKVATITGGINVTALILGSANSP